MFKDKPWPKIGSPITIGSKRGRSLVSQSFLVNGVVEDFVLYTCDSRPVVIFPVTTDKKVLAVKLFRPGANKFLLELPGGNSDSEAERLNLTETAKRELLEETGYDSNQIIPLFKEEVWFDPSVFNTRFFPFIALDCYPKSKAEYDLEKMGLDKWFELCYQGSIIDSKTLSTTLLAQPYFK